MPCLPTVLIPVNSFRPNLKRTVEYYLGYNLDVVVVDSSKNGIYYNNSNITIYHFPGCSFPSKIIKALSEINNQSILLSPDDDIINIESLGESLSLQNFNEKACIVFGSVYEYHENKKGFIKERPFLKKYFNKASLEMENKILYHCRNYDLLLWSLYKKSFLFDCMQDLKKINFQNDNFIEITTLYNLIINGSYYSPKNFWMLRCITFENHWGARHKAISLNDVNDIDKFVLYFEEKYKNNLSRFFINSFIKKIKIRTIKYKIFYLLINFFIIPKYRYFKLVNQNIHLKNYLSSK